MGLVKTTVPVFPSAAAIEAAKAAIRPAIRNGALPTESVAQIFKSSGTQDRFERLKKGESLEALVAEAAAAEVKRAAPVRTSKS